MSTLGPVLIQASNLSLGWGQVLLRTIGAGNKSLAPVMLSLSEFNELPAEDTDIRSAVDGALIQHGKHSVSVRVTALTIFPYDFWCRRGKPSCETFSDLCTSQLLPRMRKRDKRNCYGTYFGRMMAYTGSVKGEVKRVDQLTHVVKLLRDRKRWPRQSALQLSCFDPAKDHSGQPVRGFPCLQQVSVALDGSGSFAISAYYPTQHIFDRGYGNYLGLCHLGAFIAHETRMKFIRFNCFIGRPELGKVSKTSIGSLVEMVRSKLGASGGDE
jgi:hypothetical protein